MTKFIYLAGPIDRVPREGLHINDPRRPATIMANAAARVVTLAHKAGWSVYNPREAFTVAGPPDPRVKAINDTALGLVDHLVVLLPDGVPTWGVPAEIERAHLLGIPVTVLSDITDLSWSQYYSHNEHTGPVEWYKIDTQQAGPTWVDVVRVWTQVIDQVVAEIVGLGHVDPVGVVPQPPQTPTEGTETALRALPDPETGEEPLEGVSGAPEGLDVASVLGTAQGSPLMPEDYVLNRPRGDISDQTDDDPGLAPEPTAHTLPVVKLRDDAKIPTRAYADDAGLDLYVHGDHTIPPGGTVDVPHGIAIELPSWSWGFILGRSSTLRKKNLLVNPAVIDAGWRGELFTSVHNPTDQDILVGHGTRVSQLIVHDNATARVVPVPASSLRPSRRGDKGFGSSGN